VKIMNKVGPNIESCRTPTNASLACYAKNKTPTMIKQLCFSFTNEVE
jgi:hypothetical protein